MVNGCPFCKDQILDSEFASSPNYRAIYNRAPILPGHSLIIPKRHMESLMALSEDELYEMVGFSRHVMEGLLSAFNASGFNWTIQEGEEAGQTVHHLHLHLIPRHPEDLPDPGDWYPLLQKSESEKIDSEERNQLENKELKHIVEKIKKHMAPYQSDQR